MKLDILYEQGKCQTQVQNIYISYIIIFIINKFFEDQIAM